MDENDAVRTVQEQVVDRLRRLILDGAFAPGDKLQQDELARRLGVSAMPVREGLRRLQAEGLVDFVPRHGAFVARLSPDEFEELYHMREELEVLALRWAVASIDAEALRGLEETLQQVEDADAGHDAGRRVALVRSFLFDIFQHSARPHLLDAIHRYYNMTYLYQRQYSSVDLAGQRMLIYRRLLQSIAAGDPDAAIAAHRTNYRLIRETMLPLLTR